jgi:hypothetical protein
VAKKTFLGGKNGGSGVRLEGGEGSGSFKGGGVIGPGTAWGRANEFLKLSGLSRGGRGGGVSGGKLRCGGSTRGRDVDGGGGHKENVVGTACGHGTADATWHSGYGNVNNVGTGTCIWMKGVLTR